MGQQVNCLRLSKRPNQIGCLTVNPLKGNVKTTHRYTQQLQDGQTGEVSRAAE